MSRYIDADRLLNGLKSDALYPLVEKYGIERVIDAQPTADVRENVRGEWIMTITAYPYCSNCRWMPEEDEMTHGFYDFCPNCGADMRGNKQ